MNPATATPKQTMRFTESELELIRSNLHENDLLLKIVRKRLLQMPLDESEISLLEKLIPANSDLSKLLKKTIHPDLDGDAPFFQMIDLYLNADVKDKSEDLAVINILTRDLMTRYFDETFEKFYHFNDTFKISFSGFTANVKTRADEDARDLCVSFLARNTILNHVDFQLSQLLILAQSTKKESPEEKEKRLKKNSTK
jgi:hypothetical protein